MTLFLLLCRPLLFFYQFIQVLSDGHSKQSKQTKPIHKFNEKTQPKPKKPLQHSTKSPTPSKNQLSKYIQKYNKSHNKPPNISINLNPLFPSFLTEKSYTKTQVPPLNKNPYQLNSVKNYNFPQKPKKKTYIAKDILRAIIRQQLQSYLKENNLTLNSVNKKPCLMIQPQIQSKVTIAPTCIKTDSPPTEIYNSYIIQPLEKAQYNPKTTLEQQPKIIPTAITPADPEKKKKKAKKPKQDPSDEQLIPKTLGNNPTKNVAQSKVKQGSPSLDRNFTSLWIPPTSYDSDDEYERYQRLSYFIDESQIQ